MLVLLAACAKHPSGIYLHSPECDETSGIVASARYPGRLYIHNDSGDINRFFVVNMRGELLSTCFFSTGDPEDVFSAFDCEDIAVGAGPESGKTYVYVADIGDNFALRRHIQLYRIEEPHTITPYMHCHADTISLEYPDGPRDAETLMIDPQSSQLYIVSKREDSVGVYSAPLIPAGDARKLMLTRKARLYLPDKVRGHGWITSGKISADGSQVVLRSYNHVYYWRRNRNETIEQTLVRKPLEINAPSEGDGEAICFSADGRRLFSTSEARYAVLNSIPVPSPRTR